MVGKIHEWLGEDGIKRQQTNGSRDAGCIDIGTAGVHSAHMEGLNMFTEK